MTKKKKIPQLILYISISLISYFLSLHPNMRQREPSLLISIYRHRRFWPKCRFFSTFHCRIRGRERRKGERERERERERGWLAIEEAGTHASFYFSSSFEDGEALPETSAMSQVMRLRASDGPDYLTKTRMEGCSGWLSPV